LSDSPDIGRAPADRRALVAVDLGAESCRVSLLRWRDGRPQFAVLHRFDNRPREVDGALRWDLRRIEAGIDDGVRKAAESATEGIRSIAVDGWAVDYVRLSDDGRPVADPFCYRDERTVHAFDSVHGKCSPDRMHALTGVQQLRINTLYQLHADSLSGLHHDRPWLNLPEYMLARWGGDRVAELTNATHTQLVKLGKAEWCEEIFHAIGIDSNLAAKIVQPGTIVGKLHGPLAELPTLRDTLLIAPACHDTASAIAGIGAQGDDWAYISSGTWSLVGTVLHEPCNSPAVRAENFTNLGGVGNRICFHKNVNGMWLLRQCIEQWSIEGTDWIVKDLVAEAEHATLPPDLIDPEALIDPKGLIDVDDSDLLLQGHMPARINAQRAARGLAALDERPANAPQFALLIFHSLAARYAEVLARISQLSGKNFKRLYIVGGGSQNDLLNRLTASATGLEVHRGAVESSTIGNFAVQLAALNQARSGSNGVSAEAVSAWAVLLNTTHRTAAG
jgi:rhamnulokinase